MDDLGKSISLASRLPVWSASSPNVRRACLWGYQAETPLGAKQRFAVGRVGEENLVVAYTTLVFRARADGGRLFAQDATQSHDHLTLKV
jgi:hypothetical protein